LQRNLDFLLGRHGRFSLRKEASVIGFEMLTTEPNKPYTAVGDVEAWQDNGNIEAVNNRLIEEAVKLGANGIINLTYQRKISWTSWDQLVGTGTAVIFEADQSGQTPAGLSIGEEIAKLASLLQSGVLSEDEFQQAKTKLLSDS